MGVLVVVRGGGRPLLTAETNLSDVNLTCVGGSIIGEASYVISRFGNSYSLRAAFSQIDFITEALNTSCLHKNGIVYWRNWRPDSTAHMLEI